jgi:hypothetical protein
MTGNDWLEVPLSTEDLPFPTLVISALAFLAPVGWRRAIGIMVLSLSGGDGTLRGRRRAIGIMVLILRGANGT